MRDWHPRAAKALLIMQLQTLSISSSGAPRKISLKAKGDRRASHEVRTWTSPPKPFWCWKAEELHIRNKSDEASVTAGIAQQGPVFILSLILWFLKFQVLSTITHHGEWSSPPALQRTFSTKNLKMSKNAGFEIWQSLQHLLKRTLPKDGKFPGFLSSSASCLQQCSAAF